MKQAPNNPTTARARPEPQGKDVPKEREVPHDLHAESGMIGSMIIDPSTIGPILELLPSGSYCFKEENAVIFDVIAKMYEKNIGVDATTIHSSLRDSHMLESVGGLDYIASLANAVPTSDHALYYAAFVKEAAIKRKIIQAGSKLMKAGYEGGTSDEAIETASQALYNLSKLQAKKTKESTLMESVTLAFDEIETGTEGLSLPWHDLSQLMPSGMQRGDMVVIAARPSVGKTAFALNIADYLSVHHGIPGAIFSMEMSRQQVGLRILSMRSGVPMWKLAKKDHGMTAEERRNVNHQVNELAKAPFYIEDDAGMRILDVRTRARELKKKYDIQYLAIDYMQLMKGSSKPDNRQQEVAEISREIKVLARELGIPVLALSQVNRSSATEHRPPRVSDLRESGAIEQDADIILILHREELLHKGDQEWINANPELLNMCSVEVAKQRNGGTDVVKLGFEPWRTVFTHYEYKGF